MRKPKVGETLYSLNVGNAARGRPQVLTPAVVSKVGRKYFTVGEGWRATQFHVDDWGQKSDYAPDQRLYESPQAWEDEKEAAEIAKEVWCTFEYGRVPKGFPLSVLREILQLMKSAVASKSAGCGETQTSSLSGQYFGNRPVVTSYDPTDFPFKPEEGYDDDDDEGSADTKSAVIPQKCRQCGKTGYAIDEFLSPYDGLCAECSPNSATNLRKRREK